MIKPLPQGKALEKGRMIPTERFAIVLPHPKSDRSLLTHISTKAIVLPYPNLRVSNPETLIFAKNSSSDKN